MGKEIFEVNFESKSTPMACFLALREQIVTNKYSKFPRTGRALAKAKLLGSIDTVFPDEMPKELLELNDAYKRCATEQLKTVVFELAWTENRRLAREKGLTAPQPNLSAVEEGDCPLMVYYKTVLQDQEIFDVTMLDEIDKLVDFQKRETDEALLETFKRTQSSEGTLFYGYEVGIEDLNDAHRTIIEYNNSGSNGITPLEEQIATEVMIGSLGFTKKEIADLEKLISPEDSPEQKAKTVRAALDAYVAKKVDGPAATESDYADAYKRCDLLVKHYLADKFGFKTSDYMRAREEEYADKVYDKISPVAEARFIRDRFNSLKVPGDNEGERDKYLHDVADCIKHLETVHAKRGFFTRFVDWFRSAGENSTLNAMRNQLNSLHFEKDEIDNAIKLSDTQVPNSFGEYVHKTEYNTVFTGDAFDKELGAQIDDYVPPEVANGPDEKDAELFDKFNSPDAFQDEPDEDLVEESQNDGPKKEEPAPETVTVEDTQSLKDSIADSLHAHENGDIPVTGKVTDSKNEPEKEQVKKG